MSDQLAERNDHERESFSSACVNLDLEIPSPRVQDITVGIALQPSTNLRRGGRTIKFSAWSRDGTDTKVKLRRELSTLTLAEEDLSRQGERPIGKRKMALRGTRTRVGFKSTGVVTRA